MSIFSHNLIKYIQGNILPHLGNHKKRAMDSNWGTKRVIMVLAIVLLNFCYSSSASESRSKVIQNLTNGYDNRISPHFDFDVPTDVRVHIYISSFDSIRESAMDYTMNFIITQKWTDPRLNYTEMSNAEILELDTKIMKSIWVPDLYFANEKKASFHEVTVPNKMMHLHQNGTVVYRARLTMTSACPMTLEKFPLDTQMCSVVIKSFVYTPDNVVFKWEEDNAITYNREMEMAQFEIGHIEHKDCTGDFEENNFTCIRADIYLNRKFEFFLLHVFIPSTLIVVISWVSFWLPIDAVPARIALGSTTVLTMITQRQSTAISLPPVSYIKAIDVWTVSCLVFVFAALLEYALVNIYSRREVKRVMIKLVPSKETKGSFIKSKQITWSNGTSDGVPVDVRTSDPKSKLKAKRIDVISRVVFPSCFFTFITLYWVLYMQE